MVDYDYLIDDFDIELMYEVALRIHDEWYDWVVRMSTDGYDQEEVR